MRLRNDDIKFLFENVCRSVPRTVIDEPVKATTEPDGSRYIEVHNRCQRQAQFEVGSGADRLIKSITAVTNEPDVDQTVVQQAVQDRSGMPVRLNGRLCLRSPIDTIGSCS